MNENIMNPAPDNSDMMANTDATPTEAPDQTKQWYLTSPALQRTEIAAMTDFKPDAQYGYMPDGKMYWSIQLKPIVCGQRKDWKLLMVYSDNHPHGITAGDSVKIYPIKPNAGEILELMNQANVNSPGIPIPRTIRDADGYTCLDVGTQTGQGQHGTVIITAAAQLGQAMRWINMFELGLIDPITWTKFSRHGDNANIPADSQGPAPVPAAVTPPISEEVPA